MSILSTKPGEPATQNSSAPVEGLYGRFSPDGREYWITDPKTPRPWVNVISNPRMGLVVSQTGSGFTWIDNSQLAVITRWEQDLTRDASGKFLYLRDATASDGDAWSLSPSPAWSPSVTHECRHGLGYTTFVSEGNGIRARWTLFVHSEQTVELWKVELENRTDRTRTLDLVACLEWNCGVLPSPRREFHKLFLETEYDDDLSAVLARNHMWEVPSNRVGHWNTSFPYVAAFGCSEPISAAQGDKCEFIGRYGDWRNPQALAQPQWHGRFGRYEDPIAALRVNITLEPDQTHAIGFALAVGGSTDEARSILQQWNASDTNPHERPDAALAEVRESWTGRLAEHRVDTPEPSLNYMVNDWFRYQAIAARLWGRCGYYQQSGAFGFRDQLQDSQVWLTIAPQNCRDQIRLHAAHQFADGSVYHWWHPLSEQGHVTRMTDDLLWLAFVTANYIRETGDATILLDEIPFIDDPNPSPIVDHALRAFRRVLKRTSPRGLPYIGAGDWNDGLSAVGLQERGESIWLGHFLAGLLDDWTNIFRELVDRDDFQDSQATIRDVSNRTTHWHKLARQLTDWRSSLCDALNKHGWDGRWYLRATLDDGTKLGSEANRTGRIFLNSQTWAILNDVAPPDRAQQCWQSAKEHLIRDVGALLLTPAFDAPDERIGYITRYAPGLRENGGVYTHAATWALAAACKMRDADTVARLLNALNPALKHSDTYWAEPYVLPGNVDGPESSYAGRGGWTWYTGSAQWLHRVVCEWVLGVRPVWDGLKIDPCLPPGWHEARMSRPWRGCKYKIRIVAEPAEGGIEALAPQQVHVTLDGRPLAGNIIPVPMKYGETYDVVVDLRAPQTV